MTTDLIEKSMRTDYFVELENQYGAHNYHPLDVVIERAEGVWVYDVEGKRYLDCFCGVSVVSAGHSNPEILKAAIDQLQQLQHTTTIYLTEPMLELARVMASPTLPHGLAGSPLPSTGFQVSPPSAER